MLGVGAVVALFVLAVVGGYEISNGDDGGSGSGPDTEDVFAEADVRALVEDLSAYVEDQRDLAFDEAVDVEVLDADQYRERIVGDAEQDLEDGREDLERAAAAYQAIGLWPADTDPVEVVRRFTGLSSVGFYDPETRQLVVLGSADTPNLRVTLVHELTHALDDQHFDLGRLKDLGDREDESASAFQSLVEGSASRVDSAYEATLSDDERDAIVDEQMAMAEGVDLGGIPPILFAEQQQVYTEGEAFVDALYADGGNDAVDDALRDPPTTSEQILEPEDWRQRDPGVEVDVPEADGDPIDDSGLGQAFFEILVGGGFGPAEDPVPEWDGDNSVLWEDGDEFCVRFAVAGDAEGYEEALTPWAERVDAELAVEDDLLVATSCS